MTPQYDLEQPSHAAYCFYGSGLFPWVPGDSGNPFVSLWQATLINVAVLAVGTLILLLIAGSTHRQGIRSLGFVFSAASLLCCLLAAIIVWSSKPLACDGIAGAPPLTASQQRDIDTFSALQALAYVAFYLTILLGIVFIVTLLFVAATGGRRPRSC